MHPLPGTASEESYRFRKTAATILPKERFLLITEKRRLRNGLDLQRQSATPRLRQYRWCWQNNLVGARPRRTGPAMRRLPKGEEEPQPGSSSVHYFHAHTVSTAFTNPSAQDAGE